MDAMRAMLDELMGKDRNVPTSQRTEKRIRFDDPSVCKYALGGLCPHGLFKNTRSDLGPCPYELHEDNLAWPQIQEDYDRQDPREHERYERRLMKLLEDLIREMDRKIAKSKERAEAESTSRPLKPDDAERLAAMQAKAKELLAKSQEAGEAGDVDVAMALSQQAEELKQQHDRLHRTLTAPERTMTVCDICGVFINSTDNDQRRQVRQTADGAPAPLTRAQLAAQEHLTGKQYLGWKAIREKYAELQAKFDRPMMSRGSREPEPYVRERSTSYPQEESRPGRERERERERSPARRDHDSRSRDYSSRYPEGDSRLRDPRDDRYRDERHRDERYRDDRHRDDRYRDDRYRDDSRSGRGTSSGSGYRDRGYEDRRRY